MSIVLRHPVWGNLFQQPWETNISPFSHFSTRFTFVLKTQWLTSHADKIQDPNRGLGMMDLDLGSFFPAPATPPKCRLLCSSSNTLNSFLPQGLCTCLSVCLECSPLETYVAHCHGGCCSRSRLQRSFPWPDTVPFIAWLCSIPQ